jgi:hypothetical protein
MKHNKIIPSFLLAGFFIVFTGIFNKVDAQVVFFPKKEKKSTSVVFFPKKTTTRPVYRTDNVGNLPPGQAKKIYGEKSAKRFAPGQRKKVQKDNWPYISPAHKSTTHKNSHKKSGKGHKK